MLLVGFYLSFFLSAAIQTWMVWGFVRRLRSTANYDKRDGDYPEAAVVLCLRGSDPFLADCIRALSKLDYPKFQICIIVDSEQDPAHECVIRAGVKNWPNAKIVVLRQRYETCSLKCSSLLTALDNISPTCQFIALLDADTIPHTTWLKELARGLEKPWVGAVTGNRWYMPTKRSIGSTVRYVWNAAAVVQMVWYRIAWGGTLAIKLTAIESAELREKWKQSFCEDTMLKKQLGRAKLTIEFVPSLMMVNREDCDLPSLYAWVKRQLLTARLYHPLWFAVVGHGMASAIHLLLAIAVATYWLLFGSRTDGVLLVLGLVAFQWYVTALLPWMEEAVSTIVAARNDETEWPGKRDMWRLFWAVQLTQGFYTAALLGCLQLKLVKWRGIDYEVRGPWQIRRLNDSPFGATEVASGSFESL